MAVSTEDLPKGFICECGEEHRFPPYVYAHFRELLDFTCPKCGREYQVCLGYASLKPAEKTKRPSRSRSRRSKP